MRLEMHLAPLETVLEKLMGKFGSTESISSFSDVMGTAADALTKFAGGFRRPFRCHNCKGAF